MTKSFMKEAVFEMLLGELSGNESYFKQKGKYEEQQIIQFHSAKIYGVIKETGWESRLEPFNEAPELLGCGGIKYKGFGTEE